MTESALLLIPVCSALGASLIAAGVVRWQQRSLIWHRMRALSADWNVDEATRKVHPGNRLGPRKLAGRLGAGLARSRPADVGSLAERIDRAGLSGAVSSFELLGWKAACAVVGLVLGVWTIGRYGPIGVALLVLGPLVGWFGIDVALGRYHGRRRRAILRDLPTIMDLLVLSLEAGMGLNRALRTVVHEYRSAISDEMGRVLREIDLGIARGEAFERMADRVGLDELRSVSRAIVQSEELGVSVVDVMRLQSHEVRLSRRRAAEAEALRAPIKMLVPVVVFILPTLFMLLLGPVGLRAAAAIGGR